jgi:hypothetical protein
MAVLESSKMRVSCVIADAFANTTIDPEQLKSLGPTWGSWRTWRTWNTDNVLCHDLGRARDLLQRAFQAVCNFYVPNRHFSALNRPTRVQVYEGDFPGEMDHPEDIVAMHLAAVSSDLILLLGYGLSATTSEDRFERHKHTNYLNAFRATLNTYPDVQFVLIDHSGDLEKSLLSITNLTCDKYETVLQLFG